MPCRWVPTKNLLSDDLWEAISSLLLMVATASIVVALAVPVAWFVVRKPVSGYQLLDTLSFIPFAVPSAVIAVALIFLFSAWRIGLYGTVWILVLAASIRYLPWTSRTLQAAQAQIHPELEKAAKVAGASYLTVLRRVVLPLLAPAVFGAWLWVLLHAMREATSAVLLASPSNVVMASRLWDFVSQGQYTAAAALSIMFAAVGLFLGFLCERYTPLGKEELSS